MDGTRNSTNILERIPVEIWNKILHDGCGFTLKDYKTLSFVAPLFVNICRPMVHKTLTARHVNIIYGYHFPKEWGSRDLVLELDQWTVDMMRLVRAERRLHLVAGDAFLSTFLHTMCIGNWPCRGYREIGQKPPTEKMVLSKVVCDVMVQLRATLTHTLPLFTQLRRLEISFFAIDDGMLRAIASHPVLDELKLGCCSFPSDTFPIPSIRVLGYNKISQKEAPAAFRLFSLQHLEELRIDNMKTSLLVEDLRARPKSTSTFTKLNCLTIAPGDDELCFLDVQSLLGYVPALRRLDIIYSNSGENRNVIKVLAGTKALSLSTVPNLQQLSSPLSFAQYIIPNRPVTHLQMDHHGMKNGSFASNWSELQTVLSPLRSSSADRITTLHLPSSSIAPIWLLSRFVAETFPQLIDLRLPVGMAKRELFEDSPFHFKTFGLGAKGVRLDVEGPFEDGFVENMVRDVKDSVDYGLVGQFDEKAGESGKDQYDRMGGSDNTAYRTRAIGSQSMSFTTTSSLEVDVAATLAELGALVEVDVSGEPSGHPKNYEEALFYFVQGWYPLPPTVQKVSFRDGFFPGHWVSQPAMSKGRCIAVATALGERYPSLLSMAFCLDGRRCERMEGDKERWTGFV